MVLSIRGTANRRGPQPGPEPAWARFARAAEQGKANHIRIHALKPEVAAYRVLGAEPPSASRSLYPVGRARNKHNSSIYVSHTSRYPSKTANVERLPFVGEIAAGQYDVTVAFQEYDCLDYENGVFIDKALARGGAYALRVRETSMAHVGVEPGDVVIVRPQNWAEDGDFVVAAYTEGEAGGSEGLATLKRFYKRRDHIFLQSATASTDPIRFYAPHNGFGPDPVRVQGVVTMILKS